MIKMIYRLVLFAFLLAGAEVEAQTTKKSLSMKEVIEIASNQSPDAIAARHRFRASYWSYRSFKANYLPSLSFGSSAMPRFDRAYDRQVDYQTGDDIYVERQNLYFQGGFTARQNIGLTGGSISLSSSLERSERMGENGIETYVSTPFSIGFTQQLFAFNRLKWDKEIEPLRFEEAKKNYVVSMEQVSARALAYFFDLGLAQINLLIEQTNHQNSDTLYQLSKGRYNIGVIAENELLQMELRFMNASSALNRARIDLESRKSQLRSFLGYNENVDIELVIEADIPDLTIDYEHALRLALQNNPDIIALNRQLKEAQRSVAQARSQRGLNATLSASFGLTQQAQKFSEVYNQPNDQQRVSISLNVPIVDWGLGRGTYKMAQSNQELVETTVEQERIDFEQNVYLQVMQFNMQDDQLRIATKADTIAQRSYEVTKQRYLIGKVTVTDLNISDTDKDASRRDYVAALRSYWTSYYMLRRIALFNFEEEQPLTGDYDKLVE